MNEELIISGRDIPNIDPYLHIWHWPIPLYLFLGGLAAGILFFAAYFTIRGREDEFPTAVKRATFIVPVALILGLLALIIDLKNPMNSWKLYLTLRLESPMSWGAWTLMAITPLSILWAGSYMKELVPGWDWKFSLLNYIEKLSAFNARPLWNTALLGPLFLVSGMSTGAAAIIWMSKSPFERKIFTRIDLLLIAVELFFIIHLFMGFLAGPEVQLEAAQLFLGGQFTIPFWGLVVFFGLILPAFLEILELRGSKIPVAIPAICILIGGLIFRLIMVDAGQLTRYLY